MKLLALFFLTMSFGFNAFAFEVKEASNCPESVIGFFNAFPENLQEGLNVTTQFDHNKDKKTVIVAYVEKNENVKTVVDCAEILISEEK